MLSFDNRANPYRNQEMVMKIGVVVMTLAASLLLAVFPQVASSTPITVDCNKGQSLNNTLAKLNKEALNTVSVSGTCTEYVQVVGFENLNLIGMSGATLQEPFPGTGTVLLIRSSRSVTVDNFSIHAETAATSVAVEILGGSSDILLSQLSVEGGWYGIIVSDESQVSVASVTCEDPGYSGLGVYNGSAVDVKHSRFSESTGAVWHVGIDAGSSFVTVYDARISNMQVGISAHEGANFDVSTITPGPSDVIIDSPLGANYFGASLASGGTLNVEGARLVINQAGQSWGATSGGVLLSDGSTLTASNGDLIIQGSNGQGIVALNNSHATLIGATVTGGLHGGLVIGNLSSIDISTVPGGLRSTVGGNGVDLFCDSSSWVTGTANISGTPKTQCTNLIATETVTLP
jgi:hypothetical protein